MILKDVRQKEAEANEIVKAKELDYFLRDKGYVVLNISPVKNSNKWLAFLIKNGEYLMATVLRNDGNIEIQVEAAV